MLKRGKMDRDVVEIVGIDSLVPKEHLLRKIDKAVDFNRLYEMVEPLYCEDNGRPSIDLILSRLVDTFISKISLTMLPVPKPHNTACVLSWEEARRWQSRSSGYSSS